MNHIVLAAMLIAGIVGHAINRWCDYVLAVYPNGQITLDTMSDLNDESKMAQLMDGANPDRMFKSAMYGVAALFLEFLGYAAVAAYVYSYQQILGAILGVCAAAYAILGAGHHVKYALAVWMFVRCGRTKDAYGLLNDIYNKLPVTKGAYVGYILYVVLLIATTVMGVTPLPIWMVVFTVLPIFVVMAPFKIIGTLHFSAIISFAGWLAAILLIA